MKGPDLGVGTEKEDVRGSGVVAGVVEKQFLFISDRRTDPTGQEATSPSLSLSHSCLLLRPLLLTRRLGPLVYTYHGSGSGPYRICWRRVGTRAL